MDDPGFIAELHRYGRQLARRIEWNDILAGTDETFRVTERTTRWRQYAKSA
jgi:hypothetical protein